MVIHRKSTYKRLLAIVLMIGLFQGIITCNTISLAATADFTITSITTTVNTQTNSHQGCSPSYGSSNSYGLGYNRYIEYLVQVEESGRYEIAASLIPVLAANSMKVYVNQCYVLQSQAFGTASWSAGTYAIGTVDLVKGMNEIRFVAMTVSGSVIYPRTFTFTKTGETLKLYRRFSEFNTKSSTGTVNIYNPKNTTYPEQDSSYATSSVATGANVWLQYDMEIPTTGYYRLNMNAGSDNTPVSVLVNGVAVLTKTVQTGGSTAAYRQDMEVGDLFLLKGSNQIRFSIESSTSAVSFTTFTLEKTSGVGVDDDNIVSMFLYEMNRAKHPDDVMQVITEYDCYLSGGYQAYLENLFYPSFVCAKLIGKGFTTIQSFDLMFQSAYDSELSAPTISLFKNGVKLSKVESGDLILYISEKLKSNIFVVAAAYDGNIISQIVGFQTDGTAKELQLSLSGANQPNLKLFFWNSLTDLKPMDVYDLSNKIYVATYGSDAGSGSVDSPFLTIERARSQVAQMSSVMQNDITVEVLPGRYQISEKLNFTSSDSGKNGYNIIYHGANPYEPAVISGGVAVKGWQAVNQGRWKAAVSDVNDIRQLYVNGQMAMRARSKYIYTAKEYRYDTNGNLIGIVVPRTNFPEFSNPQNAELVYNILWTNQRVPVNSVVAEGDNKVFIMDQPYYNWAMTKNYTTTSPTIGQKFYIENALEFVDEPGEFYFNKDTKEIFYYPFADEDMTIAQTYVGKSEYMIWVKGTSLTDKVSNLVFDNLEFQHGTWMEANTQGVSVHQADCIVDRANQSPGTTGRTLPAQFAVAYAEQVQVRNCRFMNLGSSAISMADGVLNSKVEGNVIHDISGSGIVAGNWRYTAGATADKTCQNIQIKNNIVRRIGLEFYSSVGIGVYYSNNMLISHNDISDTPYTGISLGWGWGVNMVPCANHTVSDNKVSNVCQVLHDGGHVYTLGKMENTMISGNYLRNSDDFGGIYFDSGSEFITVQSNVVTDSRYWLFAASAEFKNLTVHNNYSDSTGWRNDTLSTLCSIAQAAVYKDENWNEEGLSIVQNAGVESAYAALTEGLEMPPGRTSPMQHTPNALYASPYTRYIYAKDYIAGGEGVAYHEVTQGAAPQQFIQGGEIVIGDTRQGEWIKYEINSNGAKTYALSILYAVPADGAKVKIYVNDVLQVNQAALPKTQSWTDYYAQYLTDVALLDGYNTIKVEFVSPFSFKALKLVDTSITGTDPEFDDGKYIYE